MMGSRHPEIKKFLITHEAQLNWGCACFIQAQKAD